MWDRTSSCPWRSLHEVNPRDLETLISRFYVEHEKNYGHFTPGEPTQLVNFRVMARGVIPKLGL